MDDVVRNTWAGILLRSAIINKSQFPFASGHNDFVWLSLSTPHQAPSL